MSMLLLGNIVSLIGSIIMVYIGLLKTRKSILAAQCVQCVFFAGGNALLGGSTGVITNVLNIVRNLVSFRWKFGVPHKLLFIAAQVGLTVVFNQHGVVGWLPVIAGVLFTWCLDRDGEKLKYVIIAGQIMWSIYDIVLRNYTAFAFDIMTLVTNVIGLFRVRGEAGKTS